MKINMLRLRIPCIGTNKAVIYITFTYNFNILGCYGCFIEFFYSISRFIILTNTKMNAILLQILLTAKSKKLDFLIFPNALALNILFLPIEIHLAYYILKGEKTLGLQKILSTFLMYFCIASSDMKKNKELLHFDPFFLRTT